MGGCGIPSVLQALVERLFQILFTGLGMVAIYFARVFPGPMDGCNLFAGLYRLTSVAVICLQRPS